MIFKVGDIVQITKLIDILGLDIEDINSYVGQIGKIIHTSWRPYAPNDLCIVVRISTGIHKNRNVSFRQTELMLLSCKPTWEV